jgi:hypothetical protein
MENVEIKLTVSYNVEQISYCIRKIIVFKFTEHITMSHCVTMSHNDESSHIDESLC